MSRKWGAAFAVSRKRQMRRSCRVRAAFHQAHLLQAVDEARNRDRGDLGERREFVLRKPRLALQPRKDDPLRPRHAVGARHLIRACAHLARHVVQQNEEVVFEVGVHCMIHKHA